MCVLVLVVVLENVHYLASAYEVVDAVLDLLRQGQERGRRVVLGAS